MPGSFLNLGGGQPDVDPHFAGATPAVFVEGLGLTCSPPAGYTQHGYTTPAIWAGGTYPYFTADL